MGEGDSATRVSQRRHRHRDTVVARSGSQTADQVLINPDRNSKLVVAADDTYSGEFHAETTMIVHTVCTNTTVPFDSFDATFVGMDVTFFGRRVGSSIKDDMKTIVTGTTSYHGSWDFTSVAGALIQ